jgi:hypothetical protein
MSMTLLEPAKNDLHNSLEDQAADHLINSTGFSKSSNFPRTPPARMRLWSASAFDQIDGGITLQRVATTAQVKSVA